MVMASLAELALVEPRRGLYTSADRSVNTGVGLNLGAGSLCSRPLGGPWDADGRAPFPILVGTTLPQARSVMAWLYVLGAGLFEIGWAIGLKYTDGFTRLAPTALTVISMGLSLWLLGLSLKALPLGTAYAVWTGIGTVGTAILGIALLGESASVVRLACIGLIVIGIAGLKVVSPE
jgi:quaternary ammonium compound-resistance protein SugE